MKRGEARCVSTSLPPNAGPLVPEAVRGAKPSAPTPPPAPRGRAVCQQLGAVERPARPSPSAPGAPSPHRLTGGGRSTAPYPTWQLSNLGQASQSQPGALSTVPCSKAANLPALSLSSLPPPPQPPPPAAPSLPAPPPIAPAGCGSSSYFLPTPLFTSAAEVVLFLNHSL